MDFAEYLRLQARMFVQYYRCRPISSLNKENFDDDGNWSIMPPSALDRLGSLNIEYPMMFQIQNPSTLQVSHCGVLEFVAEEGFIHIPTRMMAHLGLEEDALVLIRSTSLPRATFIKLQPHTTDFLDISNPRGVLEYNFGKYPCLTTGETMTVRSVMEGDKSYYLEVVEARPADAVCTLETDCEVDFAQPLDYKPPPPPPVPVPEQPVRYAGVGMRMDGQPLEHQQQPPPAPVPSTAARPKRVLQFGPSVAASEHNKEEEGKRFAGYKYSLQD